MHTGGIHAHAFGRSCLAVVQKDVPGAIRVTGDEVAGVRSESHIAAIRANAGKPIAFSVPLRPSRIYADALGGTCLAIMDENVFTPIRVPRDEVPGLRWKSHVATIRADVWVVALKVPLHPSGIHADASSALRIGCRKKQRGAKHGREKGMENEARHGETHQGQGESGASVIHCCHAAILTRIERHEAIGMTGATRAKRNAWVGVARISRQGSRRPTRPAC